MSEEIPVEAENERPVSVALPAPTTWPLCVAVGVVLIAAGLLTIDLVGVLGAVLAITGFVGWFREVLPAEKLERVAVTEKEPPVVTRSPGVIKAGPITGAPNRARLPLEVYPVSAGVKGGLAGAVTMAALAIGYGAIRQHSVFYAVNLLAAGFFPRMESAEDLASFHLDAFVIAFLVHLSASVLVGLLYGAMLPMVPRHPVLLGGAVAPLFWTGLLHGILGIINPVMNRRIDWGWFLVTQLAFGIVAGLVVTRQQREPTWQKLPLAVRAGLQVQRDERDTNGDGPGHDR